MKNTQTGVLAMIAAASSWGVSPIYYKMLSHVPAVEVMAHRTVWSLVFFVGILAFQGRLGETRQAMHSWRRVGVIALAALMVSTNWFLFILGTQLNENTQTSLGYYIYPLVAVLMGRFFFAEQLLRAQWVSVALAALAVTILTLGLGVVPWISLTLATTFALYGAIKKLLPIPPMVSVTCEVMMMAPVGVLVLIWFHRHGQGVFGSSLSDTALLIASGPVTAVPLILFTMAARRISMSTVGVLQYINPTLQFLCAVMLFGEAFTLWDRIAFPLIWLALLIYSVASLRHDRVSRRASMAVAGVSTHVTKSKSDASANP